jgi:hypothetical protein
MVVVSPPLRFSLNYTPIPPRRWKYADAEQPVVRLFPKSEGIRHLCHDGASNPGDRMASRFSEYRGFDINAGAVQLTGADRYVSTLIITKHDSIDAAGKTFSAGYFNTAKDAMKSATIFARAVIDGRVARISVSDM